MVDWFGGLLVTSAAAVTVDSHTSKNLKNLHGGPTKGQQTDCSTVDEAHGILPCDTIP